MSIFGKPQYTTVTRDRKSSIPEGLWVRCPISGEIVFRKDIEKNYGVIAKSGYHYPLPAPRRVELLIDAGTWKAKDEGLSSVDPLKFKGVAAYTDKVKEYQKRTGLTDAVIAGVGELDGLKISLAIMDFRFLGGSMGSVVGEKIARAIDFARENRMPLVIISKSGGARMMEAAFSLMQMAKTSAKLALLARDGVPYISLLTDPTTGGITASFAMLGDFNIAEPEALIGFAGPRVIKETIGKDLPKGFQSSEFLLEHGFVDMIVHRNVLKDKISLLLSQIWD